MSTIKENGAVLAFALAALCVIGIIILAAMDKSIPDVLSGLALVAGGGGAGIATTKAAQ